MKKINELFQAPLEVVNLGIQTFEETLTAQAVKTLHVEWSPAAGGDPVLLAALSLLSDQPKIEAANAKAIALLQSANPVWVDVVPAKEAIGLDATTFLHAGPPVTWSTMSVPMQGAIIAALKYEGLASGDEEARSLAASGSLTFQPCHERGCVGPMTGVISASMPLLMIENTEGGNRSYSSINEGAGDVARFGAYTENTVRRLKWIETVLAPLLQQAIRSGEGINLKLLMAQALNMGDELHMRNNSATPLFLRTLVARIAPVASSLDQLNEVISFLTNRNDQFFLNFAMAAMKAMTDAAHGIEYSTLVTAMARNGVDIGIRVSGLGNQWFTAPAADVDGLYFPGYTVADANPDIGDSAIMETGGAGGFAMAAGAAIVKILGNLTYQDALQYTLDMYEITMAESQTFTIPNLEFRGTPLGIDIRKVVQTGVQPVINTAIASKVAGGGMIGAGVAKAPKPMFQNALLAFQTQYKEEL